MPPEIGLKMDAADTLLSSSPALTRFSNLNTHWHGLVVLMVALVLSLPCLVSGIPGGGDSVTHVQYQQHFSDQFWAGDLYPRWLMDSNKGYGSPIFLVQYPLPYWITALIRPIVRFRPDATREARELGVFCFLALAGAGLAARFWIAKRIEPVAATAAALLYMALPLVLGTQLYQAAIGQLTASIWMPLALAACEPLRLTLKSASVLGIVLALLATSNLIVLVLFLPLMIGYAFTCREAVPGSFGRCTVALLFSLSIGLALAGVYLLPLAMYHRLFDLNAMALYLPGMEVSHNFAFLRGASLANPLIAFAAGSASILAGIAAYYAWKASTSVRQLWCLLPLALGASMLIPGLGLTLIRNSGLRAAPFDIGDRFPERMLAASLLTIALGVISFSTLPREHIRRQDRWLAVVASASFFLMLPWSAFLWDAVPTLATAIQFPHRFGGILTVAVTGLFAAGIDSSLRRQASCDRAGRLAVVIASAFIVITAGAFTWRADWWWVHGVMHRSPYRYDESRDVDPMYRTYIPKDRLPAFAKLVGTTPSTFPVDATPTVYDSAWFIQGQGAAHPSSRKPGSVDVSFTASQDSVLRIAQLYWPLWKGLLLDQKTIRPNLKSSDAGLIEVALVPGRHHLHLLIDLGWPERYGVIVTWLAVLVAAGGVLSRHKRSNIPEV